MSNIEKAAPALFEALMGADDIVPVEVRMAMLSRTDRDAFRSGALAVFASIDRDELAGLLTSPVHAPTDTHSRLDGSCTECPWPLIQLPPEEIADAVLAWLTGKEHS